MESVGRRPFLFPSFNPTRQKQQQIQQNVLRQPRYIQAMSSPITGGSAESQIANLQQCISAYLDSIQMVCRAGSWLSETFSYLLHESSSGPLADEMKSKFSGMLQLSVSTTLQAKNDLARTLMELSLPNLINSNNQVQAIKDCKIHNAKVLEKCIQCLSVVHNSFFKVQLNIKTTDLLVESPPLPDGNRLDYIISADSNNETSVVSTQEPNIDFAVEWNKLCDTSSNVKSWFALKERNASLRKYIGLTDQEIQNLLKSESVSDLYLKKLNQKIDTALRNYEVGLRGLSSDSVVVFGGFYSCSDKARLALYGCCSQMGMEQNIQRLPVSQFLHCELPLMALTVNKKEFSANSSNSSANINQKKNAVRQLIQSTNQKLSISETDELSSEILGEICPARWRTHVKASLQLLYGNAGLIILDTMSSENKNKQNAVICRKNSFIIVAVTSTWCIKEDLGTMSLLQRNLDPEKTLATIHVRYVSVFNNKAPAEKRSEPGIFVETFVQTGSQNRRKASQSLRALQTLSGMPVTAMSTCWLTNQQPANDKSAVLLTRIISASEMETKVEISRKANTLKKSSSLKSEGGESNSGSERKRKKKIVVEIKEGDTASEEEKSSDNDDSVKDVINLLSGSSRRLTRRRFQIERDAKEAETDEMSENIEKILDSNVSPLSDDLDPQTGLNEDKHEDISTISGENMIFTSQQEIHDVEAIQAVSQKNIDVSATKGPFSETHFIGQPDLSQSQNSLNHVPDPRIIAPFHHKLKSQTLPVSFPGASQSQQHIPMHQYTKSLSNTLPHLRGRNIIQPHPLVQSGYPALHQSNQNMAIPAHMHPGLPPPDFRHFFQQRMSPHHVPAAFPQVPPPSPSPRPPNPIYPNMNHNSHVQVPPAQTPSPVPIIQPRFPINPSQQMIRPPINQIPMQHVANMPTSQTANMGPMPPFPPPASDGVGVVAGSCGNVQSLLQHFNNLSVETGSKPTQTGNTQNFDDNSTIQHLLMMGQRQEANEKIVRMQQNSNNNNIPPPSTELSHNQGWNLGGNHQMEQNSVPDRSQILGPNYNNINQQSNMQDYNAELMRAAYQEQMRMQQEMIANDGMRSGSPNEMDQFVNASVQGSLGPIGSPVVTRRRANDNSPLSQLVQQQQGCNTWPSAQDLPSQGMQIPEDQEYEQYVAGITKNAIQRKMMSQRSIDEQEKRSKSNTWDYKYSDSWTQGNPEEPGGNNLFTVFNTPDIVQHLRGHEMQDDVQGNEPIDLEGANIDPGRTGTWPPWQMWSNPNGNLWNWGDDVLNGSPNIDRVHNAN